MDRRTFLKWTAAAGVTLTASPWLSRRSHAESTEQGNFYITIHAAGGWDPTMLCDPKGASVVGENGPVNTYATEDIETVGPFRVAPIEGHVAFFERFQDQLLVINGIDTQTNNHLTGTRHTWSGSLAAGTPAFAALVAAQTPNRPGLAFLSQGGYDVTAGTVPLTRLPSPDSINALAYPNHTEPGNPDSKIFTDSTLDRLQAAREARLTRLSDYHSLPRERTAVGHLEEARLGDNDLYRLSRFLPDELPSDSFQKKVQVILACFRAGASVSASLSVGGFDTHSDHDNRATDRLQSLLANITYLMDEAEAVGLADRIVLLVGSEIGRRPFYNENGGKDHWPVTSFMAMGPGIQGGRVIGGTTDGFRPLSVNPDTLELDDAGVRITPGRLHGALRALADLSTPELASFPVDEALPLFG